jgi:hypothetical protein
MAAHLDQLSGQAWAAVENPGPVISSGKLVTGADGRPVPDTRVALEALRLLVAIDERRAKLLGLDAPRRQMISVLSDEVLDQEIAKLTEDLAAREARSGLPPAPRVIESGGDAS